MNDELKILLSRTAKGKYSRRAFLGRAGGAGNERRRRPARFWLQRCAGRGPKKGGYVRWALAVAKAPTSLDPALSLSQAPYNVLPISARRWRR